MNQDSSDNPIDEAARRRFELARRADAGTRIEDYLPPPQSAAFLGTLEELVCIDLEFAWTATVAQVAPSQQQQQPPPRVESCLARFPALAGRASVRRLVQQEYQLRCRSGDRPAKAEYAHRFPELFDDDDDAWLVAADETAVVTGSGDADETLAVDTHTDAAELPDLPGYQVLSVAGRGGMGIVLKARDLSLNRLVAIKLPLRGSLSKPEADRFLREARAAAGLRHPNICPIYEVGEHRGRPYIAMGYVEGPTLQAWAKENHPTAHDSARMIAAVARSVAYAHEHGVVHRDIKPANVLVEADGGQPVLTDFGLAEESAPGVAQSLVTQDGTVMGTPAYMSPEQAVGLAEAIGPSTDIYSLGAVLYELLCGEPPFVGSVGEILKKVQVDAISPLRRRAPRVHRDLETICMKATEREPRERYASAAALADDLDRFVAGEAILARREGPGRKAVRLLRRHPAMAAALAAVLALAAAAGFLAHGSSRTRQAADLRQQIESRLGAGPWTAEGLGEIDALIDRLSVLDGRQAESQRSGVRQALAQSIEVLLREPSLTNDVEASLEQRIGLLSSRSPEQAAALRDALGRRRREWESVFVLEPPFKDLAAWRESATVRHEGGELVFTPKPEVVKNNYAPLPIYRPHPDNVELEVVVAGDWARAPLPVLVLGGPGGAWPDPKAKPLGYAFWIDNPKDAPTDSPKAADATVTAGCARDNVTLRTWTIKASALSGGTLRMLARREGTRLSLQINDLPPLETEDLFVPSPRPLPVYLAYLPPGARLTRVRAGRQAQSAAPSPLEHGDLLFHSNKFGDALAYYQEQAVRAGAAAEAAQEARYKQGLCLAALARTAEAERVYESLLTEPGDRWPALAGCQLLAARLRQNRFADADAVLRTLRARFPAERLRPLVPHDVRIALYADAASRFAGLNSYARVTPEAAETIRLVWEINGLFFLNEPGLYHQFNLLRAYEMAGMEDEALKQFETLFREPPTTIVFVACEHYGCMMRTRGQVPQALAKLDSRLFDKAGAVQKECVPLLIERARLHAAAGDAAGAEDLDDYMRLIEGAPVRYYPFDGAAAVMRGLLRQDRGDTEGARSDWRWGTLSQFTQRQKLDPASGLGRIDGFQSAILALIAGALADDLTDQQVEELIGQVMASHGGKADESQSAAANPLSSYLFLYRSGVIDQPPSTFRQMWLTPRGRKQARAVAFRTQPLPEMARQSLALGVYQTFRQGCLSAEPTEAEDAALWEIALMSCDAARDHKVGKEQLVKLFLAWKGTTGMFGWGGVQKSLDPSYRAAMAYVFGKRCLILKQPKDAAALFKQVTAAPEAEARLKQLAQVELDRLPK